MLKQQPPYLILVDKLPCPLAEGANRIIVTAQQFLTGDLPEAIRDQRFLKVVNLCSDLSYLRSGYYCSLLAEARGYKCLPSVSEMVHAKWKRVHKSSLPDLETLLGEVHNKQPIATEEPILFCFGRCEYPQLARFGRKLFDKFRLPIMQVHLSATKKGIRIKAVEPQTLKQLGARLPFFESCLSQYSGTFWTKKNEIPERYWLAILHDPTEPRPPSNQKALEKMVKIGKRKRFYVELITPQQFDDLLEYDALFIRATTGVNHYTFRFAQKAQAENIPCIDDTDSILRCCNKVYLHELLHSKRIPTPKTAIVNRFQNVGALPDGFSFPVVLKIPDGSFSTGVFKVKELAEYQDKLKELFKTSELVLVQEFLPSDYDWRITTFGGEILLACKYFMAKKHWQIYNHGAKRNRAGEHSFIPVEEIREAVAKTALKAAKLMGDGLYGVDMKEINGKPYVIEVNDNPNIDAGVEDELVGEALYEKLFDRFEQLILA